MKGIPKHWDANEIKTRFSIIPGLNDVFLVKNVEGRNTGKVIINYKTQEDASAAIKKFNNRAVENLVCEVTPYFEEGGFDRERKDPELLAKRIYLMNVPYDATMTELTNLVKDHAPGGIQEISVARDKSGLARGFAFVYLNDANDVKRVIEYVDGRHIRNRQIRAMDTLSQTAKG